MMNRRYWIYALIGVVLAATVILLGLSLYKLNQNNQTITSLRSVNSSLQSRLNEQNPAVVEELRTELETTRNAYQNLEAQLDQANESVTQLSSKAADYE